MWGPQGEKAWPGGPHPAQIAALNEQARRNQEAWEAMIPEQQQEFIAKQQEQQARAARLRASDAVRAEEHALHQEQEIKRLLALLAAAGGPGLQDRVMTGVKDGLFGTALFRREFPVTIGQAWPCGDLEWSQRESSSIPPRKNYPTGVSPVGQLVPMSRLLATEPRPRLRGRDSGASILFSEVQISEPVKVGPLGKAATDSSMRALVRSTLESAAAGLH